MACRLPTAQPMLYTPAFAALFVANLCLVSSYAGFFLFPLYITAHGGSQQDIGILMGVFALASALCRPWISELIDRTGRKHSYTIGAVIMVLMPLCHLLLNGPINQDYPALLVIRAVHGVGLALCFTAVFTLIVDLIPPGRLNEGIGMFGISGLLGLAAGPALVEPLLLRYGDPALFIAAATLSTAGLLLHLPLKDLHTSHHAERSAPSVSFFALLKERKQLVCGGLAVLFGVGVSATGGFVAPFTELRQVGPVALYYGAYSCAAVGVRFVGGRLTDRIGETRVVPWGFILGTGGLLLLPLVGGPLPLMLVGLIFGTGHGLLFPALNSMTVRGEPYAVRGKLTGIFTGGIDSGAFCGSLLLGMIGEYAGYSALFICAGLVMLMGLGLFRLRPRQAPEGAA